MIPRNKCEVLRVPAVRLLHQDLHDQLVSYRRPIAPPLWLLKSPIGRRLHDLALRAQLPQGLYIYGGVGCGKTFLMDIFYDHAPQAVARRKRRTHFHSFMLVRGGARACGVRG